jgi:hypothetical protein
MRKEDTMHAEQEFVHEELVPLVLIAAEVGEPVELVVHRFGDDVQLDDVGMRVVSAAVARRFFTALAEQEARMQEQHRINQESASRDVSLVGGAVLLRGRSHGFSPYGRTTRLSMMVKMPPPSDASRKQDNPSPLPSVDWSPLLVPHGGSTRQ